ncbi:MAG: hypothetical protein H0T62_05280 [Parachlamydiaceae bacterium]|nr:hypothetical protein [Parachlamydiaceae bacterium]
MSAMIAIYEFQEVAPIISNSTLYGFDIGHSDELLKERLFTGQLTNDQMLN